MQVGELVAVVAFEGPWECPFSHSKSPATGADNVMPPVDGKDKNDADKLGKNVRENYANKLEHDVTITVGTKESTHKVQYTPHHLVPGNETWPDTKLLRWVDKKDGQISNDIGYSVNHAANGVDLPGIHGIGSSAWSGKSKPFQKEYAFAAMLVSTPKRQFHDRHPKYSAFVVNSLDAIAEKLDKKNDGKTPGCDNKKCGGSKKKPFDPPVELVTRLNGVAMRLEGYLTGPPSNWRKPILTSRFALMYMRRAASLTQDQARAEMSAMPVG